MRSAQHAKHWRGVIAMTLQLGIDQSGKVCQCFSGQQSFVGEHVGEGLYLVWQPSPEMPAINASSVTKSRARHRQDAEKQIAVGGRGHGPASSDRETVFCDCRRRGDYSAKDFRGELHIPATECPRQECERSNAILARPAVRPN